VTLTVENGRISSVRGGPEARAFEKYLGSFNDDRTFRFAHATLGINPGILDPCGSAIANERVFGAFVFGFGSQGDYGIRREGPMHCDVVSLKSSLTLDELQVVRNGRLVYPDFIRIGNRKVT
jgi:leucyl aminopeptidase (aminopeptidase T)